MKYILAALFAWLSITGHAFNGKSSPVQVIIPFAAGGGVDQTFRHFETWANKRGIVFTPQYKPGADGLIGMDAIASAPKDGYTVSFGTAGTVATQRIKNPTAELTVVTSIRSSITGFVVSNKSNIKTIDELEKRLRNNESLTFGVGAPGQAIVLNQVIELSNGKEKSVIVNYKGGNPVVVDLVGGHIDVAGVPLNLVDQHVDANRVKLIAVSSDKRLEQYSSIPTITEKFSTYKNLDGMLFILPPKTDKVIVDFWSNLLKEYVNDTTVKKDFIKDYYHSLPFGNSEAEKLIENTRARLVTIIK